MCTPPPRCNPSIPHLSARQLRDAQKAMGEWGKRYPFSRPEPAWLYQPSLFARLKARAARVTWDSWG